VPRDFASETLRTGLVAVLDPLVGLGLLTAALAMRRSTLLASLAAAAGALWFLGDIAEPLVFAHRGPLTHLLLIYPRIRVGWRRGVVIGATYVASLIYPIGRLGVVTIAIWLMVLVCVLRKPAGAAIRRRSQQLAGGSAAALWSLLAIGAVLRIAGVPVDRLLIVSYEVTILAIMTVLIADDWYTRWRPASLTALALDLGEVGPHSLQQAIAQALRDPTVRLGLHSATGLVDETGRAVELEPAPGRVVTELDDGQRPLGAIQHDPAVLSDPALLRSVKSLIEIALANIRLQQDINHRIADVESSRLRLMTVADAERSALAATLQESVQARLERAAALVGQLIEPGDLPERVLATCQVVEAFSRGMHPRLLDDQGLAAAITDLAESVPCPIVIDVSTGRLPAKVEQATYFVCAEALTNVVKHASASKASVTVSVIDGWVVAEIADDGIGGAAPQGGGGLAGLQDRLDIFGGTLHIQSSLGAGTIVQARIPLTIS